MQFRVAVVDVLQHGGELEDVVVAQYARLVVLIDEADAGDEVVDDGVYQVRLFFLVGCVFRLFYAQDGVARNETRVAGVEVEDTGLFGRYIWFWGCPGTGHFDGLVVAGHNVGLGDIDC